MRRRITYKVSGEELEAISKFSRDVGLSIETLAHKCLLLAMQQAYIRSESQQQQGDTVHATSGITEGAITQDSSGSPDSTELAAPESDIAPTS